jgi:hypothetical protein
VTGLEIGREALGSSVATPPVGRRLRFHRTRRHPVHGDIPMTKQLKITLSASRDIPLGQAEAQPVERAPRQGGRVD